MAIGDGFSGIHAGNVHGADSAQHIAGQWAADDIKKQMAEDEYTQRGERHLEPCPAACVARRDRKALMRAINKLSRHSRSPC
jgi:hypothetical protein